MVLHGVETNELHTIFASVSASSTRSVDIDLARGEKVKREPRGQISSVQIAQKLLTCTL